MLVFNGITCAIDNVLTNLDPTVVTENLCNGKFHLHLRDMFAPQVVRYVDLMESSIAQSIHRGFEKERWEPQG